MKIHPLHFFYVGNATKVMVFLVVRGLGPVDEKKFVSENILLTRDNVTVIKILT